VWQAGQTGTKLLATYLGEAALHKALPMAVDVGELARYDRPMPSVADYDTLLLSSPCAGRA
jgi:hypothetical protein